MRKSLFTLVSGMLLAGTAMPLLAADPNNGEDLFETNCGDCHSVSSHVANRKGPSLYRVVGRRAASVPGFAYSRGMATSGIVWSAANLDAYLANPKGRVPTGTMKFRGLPRPSDRADIIAYLTNP